MKLDWEINECRVLKAKVGEDTYFVAPGVLNLWNPHRQNVALDGTSGIFQPAETGMSLANAIAWCEKDAECLPQPIEPGRPTAETARKMSGKTSMFPSTMDARDWAVRSAKAISGGCGDASALREWFQAALSHGFREGQAEVYRLRNLARGGKSERAIKLVYPLKKDDRTGNPMFNPEWVEAPGRIYIVDDKGERIEPPTLGGEDRTPRFKFVEPPLGAQAPESPGVEATANPARPVTQVDMEQYVGKALAENRGCDEARLRMLEEDQKKIQYNWNVDLSEMKQRLGDLEANVPPLPPGVEERLAGIEATLRTHPDAAGDLLSTDLARVGFVQGLVYGAAGQLDKRIGDLETRVMGISAELPMWGRRIEELERAAKVSAEANHLFHRAIEGRVFNLEART